MQFVQAGPHKMVLLEYDQDVLSQIARQAGFRFQISESERAIFMDLEAENRKLPLLLFDASEPSNAGWFSRCQFYVDGLSGHVLQTPISLSNKRDPLGRIQPESLKLRLSKELPPSFRLPGRQAVSEPVIYGLLYNFMTALTQTGVAVCGGPVFLPLSGRRELQLAGE